MHIEFIKVSGFRLFEDLSVQLNPGLNLIVGENDAGKTSFIDAIRICLGTNSGERTYLNEQDFWNGCNTLTIQIKFTDVKSHAFRFVEHLTFEDELDEDGISQKNPKLYVKLVAKKTGTVRRGYPYIQSTFRSGVEGDGPQIETEIREFLAATYLKPLRDAKAELSTGRTSRLSQILSSSSDIQNGAMGILEIIARANSELLADGSPLKRSADDIKENYLNRLIFDAEKEKLGAFIDIAGVKEASLQTMSDSEKSRLLRTILEGLSLALSEDGRLHGLGYHNLLFMAAELLLLEQESNSEFPLLLVEEPEAHLHPQLQLKLLQFIETKVTSKQNGRGIQCILSTHSPNLASKADPGSIIMFGQGNSWSMRERETELVSEDYVFVQKFLDVTKASLFFARGILLVEGDAENILLPTIARLLGRDFESHGISIIKYDNSGSWKRFVRLFLRLGMDNIHEAWHPTRVAVLRDLDLWPDCAEESDLNDYGFKTYKARNHSYWHRNCVSIEDRKTMLQDNLSRQNVKVFISNDWTLEFCLAKYGLFSECFQVINDTLPTIQEAEMDDDVKGTLILDKAQKTDFAYKLAKLLEEQLSGRQKAANDALEEGAEKDLRVATLLRTNEEYALELRHKLPTYIVDAIEYLTVPFPVLAENE